MTHNSKQVANSQQWADEWAEVRRVALKNLRQQRLELRMQDADPATIAQVEEAWSFVAASLRSLETASHRHAATLQRRIDGVHAS